MPARASCTYICIYIYTHIYMYVYTLYSTCFPLDLSPDAFRAVSHPVCPGIRVSRVLTATSEFPKLCRAYKRARSTSKPHATLYFQSLACRPFFPHSAATVAVVVAFNLPPLQVRSRTPRYYYSSIPIVLIVSTVIATRVIVTFISHRAEHVRPAARNAVMHFLPRLFLGAD